MKWKANPKPLDGQTRTVKRFAFFPVRIDGFWVWLEVINAVQRYVDDLDDPYWNTVKYTQI